jgi:alkaline phosphatase D
VATDSNHEPPARSKIAAPDEADRLGPVVGEVRDRSAWVWLRRFKKASTRLAVKKDGQVVSTLVIKTPAERDWTGAAKLEGLEPGTHYRLEVIGGGQGTEFRTAPAADAAAKVRFVFSGDLGGQNACRDAERGYPIFAPMAERQPDFFLALGDMIYADELCEKKGVYGNWQVGGQFAVSKRLEDFWAHWRYNRADPAHRKFLSKTSMLAVWDDHEVVNDFGPEQPLFAVGLQAFIDYNPLPRDSKELYRRLRWGKHVELFLLDTRSNRRQVGDKDSADSPKTLLGKKQRDWLVKSIADSDATWKLVVSSVPLAIPTGTDTARDGWSDPANQTGYERELAVILSQLMAAKAKNLVFLTTDVHFATGFVHRPKSKKGTLEILELVVGPLSAGVFPNKAFDRDLDSERLFFYGPESLESIKSFDQALGWFNFGAIEVKDDGTLRFEVVNGKGEIVHQLERKPD